MFFDYELSGSMIWGESFIDNQIIKENVDKYSRAMEKYRNGDKPVALCLSRGPIAVYCMLGLLESGIPFLNIDKKLPIQRVKYMLETVEAEFIISDSKIEYGGIKQVLITELEFNYDKKKVGINYSDIAYYMCTSGTTGRPKAVKVLRRGLNNFFDGILSIFHFKEGMRILNVTSYSFDIVFLELFFSLYNSLCVVLTSDEEIGSVKKVINIIERSKIDIIQVTPSRLRMMQLIDSDFKCLSRVKYLLVGGEAFPIEILAKLQKNSLRIFNMYGPTETTIWSTVSDLTEAKYADVGFPIVNTDIFIVDKHNNVCKNELEGEICIGGAGLSLGYANNEEATNAAFLYLSINGEKERVYKTGDLGKIGSDGRLYCLGRLDNQIKINGNRIELEDIDRNIENTELVKQARTCFDKEKNLLVAFYINDIEVPEDKFIEALRITVSDIMIPKRFIKVDEFIYTISGKVDRSSMLNQYVLKSVKTESNDESKARFFEIMEKFASVPFLDTTILSNLIVDSIVFVELAVALEEAFSFEFDEDALDESRYIYVSDLYNYVKDKSEFI